MFFGLKPFSERKHTAAEINAEINAKIAQIQQGFGFSIMPPPILGLGQGSGYSLYVQDRAGLGYGALQTAVNTLSGSIMQTPGMHFLSPPIRPMCHSWMCRWIGIKPKRRGVTDGAVQHAADLSRLLLRE